MRETDDTGTTSSTNAEALGTSSNSEHPRNAAGGASTEIGRLRFELLSSALYHDIEQVLWMRLHQFMLFIVVLLGSSAIAAFGASYPFLGQIAGVLVAIISAAQLVWDFGGRARDHKELRRRYYNLLAETEESTCDMGSIRSRMTAIYADEPPIRQRANKLAHNQAGESLFGDDFDRV